MSKALELATNPVTSPENLITLLSENQDNDEVITAIAVHPNMTKELLIALIQNDDPYDDNEIDYFHKTERNPAIDLLLLEHPNLVEDIYLACFDEFPDTYGVDDMAATLSYWEEYSSFVYSLPNWFIEIAVKHKNEDLRAFVAGRIGSLRERHIELLLQDEPSGSKYIMASSPCAPDYVLEKLAQDKNLEVRVVLAENIFAPAEILEKLAEDDNEDVRSRVAENRNTPAYVLRELLKDEDSRVRRTAARNNNISAST